MLCVFKYWAGTCQDMGSPLILTNLVAKLHTYYQILSNNKQKCLKKIFKSNSNTIIWWLWLWIPWPTWSDPNHFSTFTQNETMNFLKELFVILKYKINCTSSCNQNMLHKQKKSISTKSYISFTIFELSTTTHDYMRWSPNWDPIQHWRNRHRSHLHQIASVPQRYQIITKPSTFCATKCHAV